MTNLKTKVITNDRPILLGKCGENEATLIKFPINVFFPFVNATSFSLVHQRHGDVAPYPCVISQGEGFINWSINSADVANQGNGVAQLTAYNEEGLVAKTVVFTTVVTDSLGYVTPPAPQTAWVDQVAGYAEQAHQSATQAAESVSQVQDMFAKSRGENSIVSVYPSYPNSAPGKGAIAVGGGNAAFGVFSAAIGRGTVANASSSLSAGWGTSAMGGRSVVVGRYNTFDLSPADMYSQRKYVVIVGNGADEDHRSNAMALDWDGNMELAGSIKLGNTILTEAQLQALLALLN